MSFRLRCAIAVSWALSLSCPAGATPSFNWSFPGFNPDKAGAPADISLMQVDPVNPGCFGAAYTPSGGGALQDCLATKPNKITVASDGAMRVAYPAVEFGTAGGAQFYKNFTDMSLGNAAFLEYDLLFEDGFEAVRGGKLPGLYGGERACSGGHPAEDNDCFSARLMWRAGFNGVTYMYIPLSQQTDELCAQCYVAGVANPTCEQVIKAFEMLAESEPEFKSMDGEAATRAYCDFGHHYSDAVVGGTYDFNFTEATRGQYLRVRQYVRLNTVKASAKADGVYALWINDRLVHYTSQIVYRQKDIGLGGLFFSTFMGGSDATWAPPKDQYARFKNFVIYTADEMLVSSIAPAVLAVNTEGVAVQTAGQPQPGGQVGTGTVPDATVVQVSPALSPDVTRVAFSMDGTCLGKLIPAVKLDNYAVAVNFPGPGTYVLCVPINVGPATESAGAVLYTPQPSATVTVLQVTVDTPITAITPSTVATNVFITYNLTFAVGEQPDGDIIVIPDVYQVAFAIAEDCIVDEFSAGPFDILANDTAFQALLSQVGTYTLCYKMAPNDPVWNPQEGVTVEARDITPDMVAGVLPSSISHLVSEEVTLQLVPTAPSNAFIAWTTQNGTCENLDMLIAKQTITSENVTVTLPVGVYKLCYGVDGQFYAAQPAAILTVAAPVNIITGVTPESYMRQFGQQSVTVPVTVTGPCLPGACYLSFTRTDNCSDALPTVAPNTMPFVYTFDEATVYTVCFSRDNATFRLQTGVNITIFDEAPPPVPVVTRITPDSLTLRDCIACAKFKILGENLPTSYYIAFSTDRMCSNTSLFTTGPVQDDCFEGCLKNAGVYMVCMSGNGTAGTYTSTNVTLTVHPDPNAIITAITPNEVAFASHKRVQFRLTGLIARGAMAGLSLTGDCHDVQQKALIGLGASYSATLHQTGVYVVCYSPAPGYPFAPQHGVSVFVQLAYCRAWKCSCKVLRDIMRSGTQYGIHGKRVPYRLTPAQQAFYRKWCKSPGHSWDDVLGNGITAQFYR